MEKKNLFRWCLAVMLTASVVFLGCPNDTTVTGKGSPDSLGAPSAVTITDNGEGSITVTWQAVEGAAKYEVIYYTGSEFDIEDPSTYQRIEVTESPADLTLDIGAAYNIMVRAGTEEGWSNTWSEAKPITPAGVPAVANLKADPSNAQVTVSWDAVTDADSYEVRWSQDGTTWTEIKNITTGTYTITGLTNNVEYTIEVRAVRGDEQSVYRSIKALPFSVAAPANVAAVSGNAQVTVSWDAVTDADSYEVRWSQDGTTWTETKDITAVTYTITGLTNNVEYTVEVRAVRGDEQSVYRSIKALPFSVAAPANVAAVSGNTEVTVSWDAVTDADSYEVRWSQDGTTWSEIKDITAVTYTITGLTNDVAYIVEVRAIKGEEQSVYSQVKATPVDDSAYALSTPNVTVRAQTPGGGKRLTVEWTQITDATGYTIYYSTANSFAESLPNKTIASGSITNSMLTDLEENTRYYVWVVATGADGAKSRPSAVKAAVAPALDGNEGLVFPHEKMAIWGEPLKNYVYIEVNDNDPRVALNWELANGKKFFDVVILFAANLRTRDCANASAADKATHNCTQNGPHIHYNGNVQHILDNRDKYIKPLQDAGIKVVLGLLGDHDPFIYYMLGQWPGTQSWESTSGTLKNDYTRWGSTYSSEAYPLGPEGREKFLTHLAGEINKYGLDGFDLDDEWSENIPGTNSAIVNRNNAEFIRIMREKLGPQAIISVYQWHTLGSMSSGQFDENAGTRQPESLVDINPNIWKYATMGGYASYGGVGYPWGGISNSQYSPFALNAGTRSGSTNYATYTNASPKYGWVLWYDLDARSTGGQNMSDFINRYAQNLYGQNVIYGGDGLDYPQDWPKW